LDNAALAQPREQAKLSVRQWDLHNMFKDADTVDIKSPTVGTYYEAPSPGDPPFVTAGSKVAQDSVVCIIEAMKVFNQITADLNGTVTEVLVKNGDAVEFGQPLFRVRLG
jgi:acetyl-CoA carboxylase biotin carboxyl carrier protein